MASEYPNVITLDVGGTSSDCALIPGAVPAVRRETVVGTLSVKAPSIDVHSVGAGGGSIAKFSALTKNLRVGPESAGADPGPACYGKGGGDPTVTDASLVLGYLPSTLLGGDFQLDLEAAVSAVGDLAAEMDMEVEDAAQGIIDLINEAMYGALRVVSVEQGYDPKDFALVVFGGAGPLHANAVGELLGSWPVIIPPSPGIVCAQGEVVTKPSHEKTSSYIRALSTLDLDDFRARFHDVREFCFSKLMGRGATSASHPLKTAYQIDLRYMGQSQEMTVTIEESLLKGSVEQVQDALREKFEAAHRRRFTFIMPQYQIELIRLRVIASDGSPDAQFSRLQGSAGNQTPPKSAMVCQKKIYYNKERLDAIVWDRKAISVPGMTVNGPCVINEMDSNTLVLPGYLATIDKMGNIIINPRREAPSTENQPLSTEAANKHLSGTAIIPTLISSALSSIRREMDTLVLRASMSPGIREQQASLSCPFTSYGREADRSGNQGRVQRRHRR